MVACRQKSMRWFDIYTDVSEEEATRLLAAAVQAELRKMEPLAGGWANSTYLLTLDDDSQLVLKLWNNKTPIEVERIIRNTCWLADHGVPTPIPLLLKDGERMLVVNDLSWMLMTYITGGWLPTGPSSLHDIGRVQAHLHQIPVYEDITHTLSYGHVFWERLIEDAGEQEAPAPFVQKLKKESVTLKQKIPEDLPRGLIHGDLSPVNVIGRKGKVLALLDLEEICAESLALDLAMTFVHFGWKDGLPVPDSWDALLAGYQSVRLLTAAEHASLPALHRYSILALAAWRYSKYVIKTPGTDLTKRFLEMVDRLDKQLPF